MAEQQGANPRALQNRPIPIAGTDFYFDAYRELRTECQVGMALGDIPWHSIVRYAEFHGIHDPDDIEDLITIIRSVERAMAEFERENNGK